MNDEHYMNREIDEKFERVDGKLDLIIAQTTKTNGRVSSLEKWQSYVVGFCACLTLLIVPIALAITIDYLKNENRTSISQEL